MRKISALMIAATSALVLLGTAGPARAEVPFVLSYQGYLTDSVGNPVTGDWTVTFGLFHDPDGGEAFHIETIDLTTQLGLFNAPLGADPDNLLDHTQLADGEAYLEITIETDVGPVVLDPRQKVISNPYSFYAQTAFDADMLGGEKADSFVTVQQIPDVCITPDTLESALEELGFSPSGTYGDDDVAGYLLEEGFNPCACYGEDDVAAFLLAAGYVPGPHFSGSYEDLIGAPDAAGLISEDNLLDFLLQHAVLFADGSVALTSDLNFGGFEALNLRVHNSDLPPEDPQQGQLWWSSADKLLRVYNGDVWALISQGSAADVSCQGCVDSDDVAFGYAAASEKGGAALESLNLDCIDCVDAAEVSFSWAKGTLPGGDALNALSADTAKDLNCAACVQVGEIDPAAMSAGFVSFDDAATDLGAGTVQAAIEKLAAGSSGSGKYTEGNGTVLPLEQSWGLPAYGTARSYMHLMNPTQPKVVSYLYGEESTSFSTSNNLVVAYSFKPNQYTNITNAAAGEAAMQVEDASVFSQGAHVMLHQSVGTGGGGTGAGNWELNQVMGVEGNTILLAKPNEHTYSSCDWNCGQAQAVIAASYNQLEVVNGGHMEPAYTLRNWSDHRRGGIIFVRARKIVVKTGGKITANGAGFQGGSGSWDYQDAKGASECLAHGSTSENKGATPNCSGGGGAPYQCCNNSKGGGGGGGNMDQGDNGTGGQPGQGGNAKGDGQMTKLHHGGGGGAALCTSAGHGGGIIVLGAETIIVETGGTIQANGSDGGGHSAGHCGGAGGGAGGTIVLYADNFMNDGTVEAKGGIGGTGPKGNGGQGGDGWLVNLDPQPGSVNESFAKGVELWIDDKNVTPLVGDPNQKGEPHWNEAEGTWGADGLHQWSTGPLDLTAVADWTLGEHKVELKETGGAGGDLKMYTYVIYPFTESTPPANDTCQAPIMLNLSGPAKVSGTTEDIMGKSKATDANQAPFCGGGGGPDVVYGFALEEWRQLSIDVKSAFTPRSYIKKGNCVDGEVMGCGTESWTSSVLEPGTYYLFVDGDGNLQKGDFVLSVIPAPPGPPGNDTCAAPEDLVFENNAAKANGMTLFSNDDYQAACGGTDANENVYKFEVPPNTASIDISVDADFNPVMYVAKENCLAPPITCIPSAQGSLGWPTPGTYYLFVDGTTVNDLGLYTVNLTLK